MDEQVRDENITMILDTVAELRKKYEKFGNYLSCLFTLQ